MVIEAKYNLSVCDKAQITGGKMFILTICLSGVR